MSPHAALRCIDNHVCVLCNTQEKGAARARPLLASTSTNPTVTKSACCTSELVNLQFLTTKHSARRDSILLHTNQPPEDHDYFTIAATSDRPSPLPYSSLSSVSQRKRPALTMFCCALETAFCGAQACSITLRCGVLVTKSVSALCIMDLVEGSEVEQMVLEVTILWLVCSRLSPRSAFVTDYFGTSSQKWPPTFKTNMRS